jgi:hypothetical protein
MNKFRFTLKLAAIAIFTLAFASLAQAQATRTWVSGVGDDVNPCSRTAPCKTFAGAISKTAAGGEIDCLDPGGFGTVTITKSIVIDGTYGAGFGSILASGVNGVNVNDSASGSPNTIVVTLRRLSINGAGTTLGVHGVNITSALKVNVQDCVIFNFSQMGIFDQRTNAGAKLSVLGCKFHQITLDGVHVGPAVGTSNTSAQINGSQFMSCNQNGIFVKGNAGAAITNVDISNSNGSGIEVASGAVAAITKATLAFNATGLTNSGGTTRLSDSTITNNTTGISISAGAVTGFSNNTVDGNGAGNAVSSSVLQK